MAHGCFRNYQFYKGISCRLWFSSRCTIVERFKKSIDKIFKPSHQERKREMDGWTSQSLWDRKNHRDQSFSRSHRFSLRIIGRRPTPSSFHSSQPVCAQTLLLFHLYPVDYKQLLLKEEQKDKKATCLPLHPQNQHRLVKSPLFARVIHVPWQICNPFLSPKKIEVSLYRRVMVRSFFSFYG